MSEAFSETYRARQHEEDVWDVLRDSSSETVAWFVGPYAKRHAEDFVKSQEPSSTVAAPPPLAVPPVPVGHPRFRITNLGDLFTDSSGDQWRIETITSADVLEDCCSVAAMAWHNVAVEALKQVDTDTTSPAIDNRDSWLAYLKQRRGE